MSSRIRNITADATDPWSVAQFWSAALGLPIHPDNEPGDDEVGIPLTPEDHGLGELIFQQVPEPKAAKNRFHLCLEPDTSRADEVERLTGLGAAVLVDRTEAAGHGWFVLADPEGNEFCVLRSAAERAQQQMSSTHDTASQVAARLVGLTRAEAERLAADDDRFDVRFIAEGAMVTLDFRPNRIRAVVAEDRVVSATAG